MGFFTAQTRRREPVRERLTVLREIYRMREAQAQAAQGYLADAEAYRLLLPRAALLFAQLSKTASEHARGLEELLLENGISLPCKEGLEGERAQVQPTAQSLQKALHLCGARCREDAMRYRLTAKAARSERTKLSLVALAEAYEELAAAPDSIAARLSRS